MAADFNANEKIRAIGVNSRLKFFEKPQTHF